MKIEIDDSEIIKKVISYLSRKKVLNINPESPISVNNGTWYYEKEEGILVVHEVREDGCFTGVVAQVDIPWAKLLESVWRKYGGLK